MLRLRLDTAERWLDLPHGVRVKVRPLTTSVSEAAFADALERIRPIKREAEDAKAAGMPLATIRAQLRSMGEITEPARVAESAADYIASVLGNRPGPNQPAPATPPAPAAQSVPSLQSVAPEPQTQEPDRSQWDRVGITPDLEIHIRRPASRLDQKRINRLIEYARQLFREES